MAFDAFLKVEGIPGESKDEKHPDWIEILSYSHGFSQPPSNTVSSVGGAGSGRVNMQDFSVVKHIDKASAKLAEACCTGKHIPSVILEICRAGGDKLKYMEYKMSDTMVSGVRPGGTSQGGDEVPLEEVAFNFGKIEWTYTQQDRKTGAAAGNVAAGWDLVKNVKV
jgi:type VI secretion system secreted protein Hcp